MDEISAVEFDDVAGGWFAVAWTVINVATRAFGVWDTSMRAVGGTLSNYYGDDMTLQIINGGNLGA